MPIFLKLGDIVFGNTEVPNEINFGGNQALSVKKYPGGKRRIDPMGRDDDEITWSGRFRGATGLSRAQFLDGLRVSGAVLNLTWSNFNFDVVIKSFKASFQRFYEIPYTITVEVVQDLNKPFLLLLPIAYNDAIDNLMIEANDLAAAINDPSVSSALGLLSIAINSVGNLDTATISALSTISAPLANAQNVVSQSINSLTAATFS